MISSLLDTELIRLSIIFGVMIGLWAYNKYGITAGGAIVPGYLALFVTQPVHIVSTIGLALVTYWVVQKQLRPRLMLWGRKLFEAEMLVSLIFQLIWVGILWLLLPTIPELALLYGIGFLIPGIIAHDMGRQGVTKTLGVMLGCTVVVFCLISIIGAVRQLFSWQLLPDTAPAIGSLTYSPEWLLVGVCVSVFAAILLYHGKLIGTLRTGGFVSAAYLALFLGRPLDLLFIIVGGMMTYLIVTQILMKQAILFGRSKVAAMVLVGMVVTWLLEFIIYQGTGYLPWQGFHAIAPMIIALLANDAQRQTPPKAILGTGLATVMVFSVMYWVG